MTSLHGRDLENEFLSIASELGGDVESREQGDAYLAGTHALYHGGPCSWALSPKIFDSKQIEILRDAAETMGRIMDKVTDRYLHDSEFRALFRLSDDLERMTLIPTGYAQLIPVARVDVFFDEETGDYQFCELNTDGSAGMTTTVEVTRAVQASKTYHRFAERHPGIETYDVVGSVVSAVVETYRSWANADSGAHHPEHPACAIVDYTESASGDEVADIIEHMAEKGVYARFADIRDLRVERHGDTSSLVDDEGPIDCVYRRAVTSEIAEKSCPGAAALEEAARRGLACLVGGYRTWPCATKTVFAILRSDAVRDVLDPSEVSFVEKHVPATFLLDAESDLAPYAQKDRWIVKPAGSYNSVGVKAGLDCATDDEWQEALASCATSGGIVQEYARQYATPVIEGGSVPEGADPVDFRMAHNMEGLYLFRGAFAGVFTRCGYQNVIGEWTHRINMGCLVVR